MNNHDVGAPPSGDRAELERALATMVLGEPPSLTHLLPRVAALVGSTKAFVLESTVAVDGTVRLSSAIATGVDAARLIDLARPVLETRRSGVTAWDLAMPAARDRDGAVVPAALLRPQELTAHRIYEEVYCRLGLRYHDTLAALDFDGECEVTTIAVVREEPFSSMEARRFTEISAFIRRRLFAERAVRNAGMLERRIDATMSQLDGAAFIVDSAGRVLRANAEGLILLHRNEATMRSRIESVIDGHPDEDLRVRDLSVPHRAQHLVVTRVRAPDPTRRALSLGDKWELTPEQVDVLALAARGLELREIASRLGLSEVAATRDMEVLLERSGSASHAALVAHVWTAPLE